MVKSNDALYAAAKEMSSNVDDAFLDLGNALRQLQDREPDMFHKLYETTDLGRRKAYYLVEVSRTFAGLPVPKARLKKVGWTKLQLLGKHINKDNALKLVELAEKNSAKQLAALMRGEKPKNNAHCVLMYFTPKEYKIVEEVLTQNGGTKSGRGIVDKERALMNVLKKFKLLEKHATAPAVDEGREA